MTLTLARNPDPGLPRLYPGPFPLTRTLALTLTVTLASIQTMTPTLTLTRTLTMHPGPHSHLGDCEPNRWSNTLTPERSWPAVTLVAGGHPTTCATCHP